MTKRKEQFPTADKEVMVQMINAFYSSFQRELKKVTESQGSGTYAAKMCKCRLSGTMIY